MKHYLHKNWKVILNIVTFALLGLAIFLVWDDIRGAFRDLGRINAIALFLMIPLQVQNYAAYAHLYQDFLRILGNKQPFKRLYILAFELYVVYHVFQSGGVSGFGYFAS
ncbi:MAG: hypothetical protein QG593_609 [Patescibacteria group bacterium]|nr:hypothetical protein [Patescibacteria group bacterium]